MERSAPSDVNKSRNYGANLQDIFIEMTNVEKLIFPPFHYFLLKMSSSFISFSHFYGGRQKELRGTGLWMDMWNCGIITSHHFWLYIVATIYATISSSYMNALCLWHTMIVRGRTTLII